MSSPQYLTVRQVADHTGLSVSTIKRAVASGELAAVRPRGQRRVLIARDVMEGWLEPVVVEAREPRPAPAARAAGRATQRGSREALRAIEGGR